MTPPRPHLLGTFFPRGRGPSPTRMHFQWGALVVAALTVTALVSAGGVAGASTPSASTPSASTPPAVTQPAAELGTLDAPYPPVAGRPNDPPAGVPIETLSDAADGAVRINGAPVRDVTDRNGDFVTVIDRSTRAVVESGTVPRDDGMAQLKQIAEHWSAGDKLTRYLMVVSGAHGVDRFGTVDKLNAVVLAMGGRALNGNESSSLLVHGRFSVVGIPGGGAGGAWQVFDSGQPNSSKGDIQGYLRVNTATNLYDLVVPDTATFATSAEGSPAGQNTVTVSRTLNDKTEYRAALPDGAVDGFQILVLDALTLQMVSNEAVPTNGPGDVTTQQNELRRKLQEASWITSSGTEPLVIVQSIGHPHGASPNWAQGPGDTLGADLWIEKFGGNRLAFDALSATSDYTLVGGPAAGRSAAEASSVLSVPGPLVGSLGRSRDLTLQVVSAGPREGVNTELVNIANQAPEAFPAFTTDGTRAAETVIGKALNLCTADEATCPVRPQYYLQYSRNWNTLALDLANLTAPTQPQGFTADDFRSVKSTLTPELSAVSQMKTYFQELQKPFTEAAQQGGVDLAVLGNAVYDAAGGSPADTTTPTYLTIISKAALLGTFLGPPASAVASGISASFGIAAYLTTKSGQAQLADDLQLQAGVRVQALALARQTQDRLDAAARSTTNLALAFLGDHGKLMAAMQKLPTPGWRLPPDTGTAVASLKQASQQWFAETLVPAVYPRFNRGTPPPGGPGDANGLSCTAYRFLDRFPYQKHPWSSQPANAQIRTTEGFQAGGTPQLASYFFSRVGTDDASPPSSLTNMLFTSTSAGGLGLNTLDFISPRVFGPLRQVNDTAPCNQLGDQGAVLSGIEVAATPNAGVGVAGTVLFATVSPTDARGTVAFADDNHAITGCDSRPITNGFATCVSTFTTPGAHTITAAYTGDGTHPPSRGSTLINVTPTPNFFQIVWGLLIAYAHNLHLLDL